MATLVKLDNVDLEGKTVLHFACIENKEEYVQMILAHRRCTEDFVNRKNYETFNNERKETSFCKFKQVSDRKHQKASNLPSNRQPVTDSK